MRNAFHKILMSGAAFSLLVLGGCSLFERAPYRETATYEWIFAPPAVATLQVPVELGTVFNRTSAGRRMLFTGADGRVDADDYSRWAQSPENMLANYLDKYFAAAAPEKGERSGEARRISLSIYRFELDSVSRKAHLEATYRMTRPGGMEKSGKLVASAPCDFAGGPASCNRAMSECAAKIASEIVNLANQKANQN